MEPAAAESVELNNRPKTWEVLIVQFEVEALWQAMTNDFLQMPIQP